MVSLKATVQISLVVFVLFTIQSGQTMAQIPYSELGRMRMVDMFDSEISKGSTTVYAFNYKNKKLYRCLGFRKFVLGKFTCNVSEAAKSFYVPKHIVERWKSSTGGKVASLNYFTTNPLTGIPEPYEQTVHSLILWNEIANKVWSCRYIKNVYQFMAPVNGKDVYFFSSKRPKIYEFCLEKYPEQQGF